LIISLAEYFFE